MNTNETTELLRIRRELTGESFNDRTVQTWNEALKSWTTDQVRLAIVAASLAHQRVTVAHVVELLPEHKPNRPSNRHSRQCLCGGTGWVTVIERNDHEAWEAWARCPDGPPTGFVESDDGYDAEAGAAAHATFNALSATAKSRNDLANACFAAAAAYRNTIERKAQP